MKRDFGVKVEWKAFELRPGLPPEGIPRPEKPGEGRELSPGVKRLADEVGLKMRRPDFIASSRLALEAAEFAREKGRFDEFHLALFKAYWEECRNIGRRDVLRDVAEKSGLPGDELLKALDEGRYSALVDAQNEEARRFGVSGIPAFIIGGCLVEGAQPYVVFQNAIGLMKKPEED